MVPRAVTLTEMVSRNRLFVYFVGVYVAVEIVVDNVLVYMSLTGREFPSFTIRLLSLLGIELGIEGSFGGVDGFALVFGVVGLLFVLTAVWQLVSS